MNFRFCFFLFAVETANPEMGVLVLNELQRNKTCFRIVFPQTPSDQFTALRMGRLSSFGFADIGVSWI